MSQIDAQVLPDDHPAVTQLNTLFGDHTFFLDGEGLKVLEPAEVPETAAQAGEIVSLANWSDASLTSLRPHEPDPDIRTRPVDCGLVRAARLPG
jgi:hypothetical protein